MSEFSSLGLNPTLLRAIESAGYTDATPVQLETIPLILSGHDVMAGAQTGTGKTAAFALPILHKIMAEQSTLNSSVKRPVKALVLAPTRELAQQIHSSFEKYAANTQLRIGLAYGGASLSVQITALKEGVDVIVATPGRLIDLLFKGSVSLEPLEYLVFDEADRMLDMGFKDEINMILKRIPSKRQTLLFSATLDDAIFKLSKTLLNKPKLVEVSERNAAASEVEQIVYNVDADRKRELMSHMIGSKNWKQVLIFTRTKLDADHVAKEMCKDGVKAQSIHGDKSQGARDKALAEFKEGKIRALVATDVAARGLDIQELKYVFNYQLPYIAEDYIHRIGRTGRAGESGLAISLVATGEEYLLEEIEALLDTRLNQQWLPGYEPDLTKKIPIDRKNTKAAQKKRAKKRAYGEPIGNQRKPSRK
ncbi:MAG: ATP-dependent RNA helicase RhlE [Psychrobacter glaciei]